MTDTLAEKNCTPCRGGVAPLTHEEAERFQSQTRIGNCAMIAIASNGLSSFRNFQEVLRLYSKCG